MKLSVRVRLTIVVAATMGLLAALAAVVAPSIVEDALIDDILVAEAEAQPLLFQTGFVSIGDLALDDLFIQFGGVPLVDGLAKSDELPELIALSGTDDLVVAIGGKSFVRVSADGKQAGFEADPSSIGQPILTVWELSDLEVVGADLLGDIGLGTFLEGDVFAGDVFDSDEFGSDPLAELFGDQTLDDLLGSDSALGDLLAEELPGFAGEESLAELFGGLFPEMELEAGVRSVDGIEFIVFGDVESVDRTVDRVSDVLWLAVPIVVLLAGVIAWLLASRALRPVRSITDQAATISGGTLDSRVPVPASGDEIADLATTVNEMLDRLESDDRRRRRFVSDASHELRSPVAVLRSEAEVALRQPAATDVEELAGAVVAESGRMATIIDDLLALARHDEGLPPPTTMIDLDDIVLAEARRTRRVPVDASSVSGGRVPGRVDEMTRLVGHLLDNAARHAQGGVRVSLQTTTHAVSLVVDDDGPGVPVAQREAIFERFTRLDEARTRDEGGAGLGLAVVASIAERSGGSVAVADSDLGGARFTITWPVR